MSVLPTTVLTSSAFSRVGVAFCLVAVLWGAVIWALA